MIRPLHRSHPLMTARSEQSLSAVLTIEDPDQWVTIAKRSVAAARETNLASKEVSSLLTDISMGRLLGKEIGVLVREPALRAKERAKPTVMALPETVAVDGAEFPLQRAAVAATLAARQTLTVYDWLVATEEGAGAARTLLAPFEGFVPLP